MCLLASLFDVGCLAQNFFSNQWRIFNGIMDRLEDSGFDSTYISNSSYRWGAGLSLEASGESMDLSPAVADTVIMMEVPPSLSAGLLLRYRPLSFTFLRLTRSNGKVLHCAYDVTGRKWGMNVSLRYVDRFRSGRDHASDADINVEQLAVTGSAYYVLRNQKFSYPAAFGQCSRQKRSAGSPLFGLGYTYSRSNLNGQDIRQASGLQQVALNMGGISAGYAQNFVPSRGGGIWLFHISGLVTWGFAGRNTQTDLDGVVTKYTQNLIFNGKTAICFARKNLWLSLVSRFHITQSGIGQSTNSLLSQSYDPNEEAQMKNYAIGTTTTEWWAALQFAWRW